MTKICDIMQRSVVSCSPDDSVREVARLMKTNGSYAIVVTHASGEVWGLVSMMEVICQYGGDLERLSAEDIMRPYRSEVDPQWSLEEAIDLMKRRKIEHLIIVDPHAGPKRPIGLLSTSDVVRHMSGIKIGHYQQILVFPSP